MVKSHKPNTELILSTQRALFRAISKNTKAIYAKIENNQLIWKAYFDEEPTEIEKELLSTAATEVLADFPEITSCEELYIYHPAPLDFKGELYYHWPFTRVD